MATVLAVRNSALPKLQESFGADSQRLVVRKMPHLNSICMLCVAIVCCGCGRGTVDFQARVTLDGQPLDGASVTLIGDGETRTRPATGISDAEGSVRFTTFEP